MYIELFSDLSTVRQIARAGPKGIHLGENFCTKRFTIIISLCKLKFMNFAGVLWQLLECMLCVYGCIHL